MKFTKIYVLFNLYQTYHSKKPKFLSKVKTENYEEICKIET